MSSRASARTLKDMAAMLTSARRSGIVNGMVFHGTDRRHTAALAALPRYYLPKRGDIDTPRHPLKRCMVG